MKNCIASTLLLLVAISAIEAASVAKPTCGGSTSSKNINLVNPANPPRVCEYHLKAYSKYVCQLRIDWAMTLAQPTLESADSGLTYAECTKDYFEVDGLRLCGTEVWQHIYVPFNATDGESVVDLVIGLADRAGATGLPTPSWDITVTQLECPAGASVRSLDLQEEEELENLPTIEGRASTIKDGFFVAPPGCLQYFPQSKGAVKSFNYNDGNGIYPSRMNYAICFRRETGTKELTIRAYDFNVGDVVSSSTLTTDENCYSSDSTNDLDADFLMVPQATFEDSHKHATYFCGSIKKDVVISSNNPGPLMVLFNSDDIYRQNEAGFAFTYVVS
ncbi:uncharacterized protein LOC122320058 [Drosophila ficusphila]|uniref:uncharacterized protein LOC108087873 n=1 Tax=Drosophila ficusphila TaxID=30025 RepID=UPI0007E86B68|nr:uncharacterized protein LOC108087873 [Drosophila ficusphila]XP_043064061.1 uncharacterized protein LOC122320058 [Drosophila ficusphila]